MCIAHFNLKSGIFLFSLYCLLQCWTLTICEKRNLYGWYFQCDLFFHFLTTTLNLQNKILPLEYTTSFQNTFAQMVPLSAKPSTAKKLNFENPSRDEERYHVIGLLNRWICKLDQIICILDCS